MPTTSFGEVRAQRLFNLRDVANLSDSLATDGNATENAIQMGYVPSSKEFYIAKDGIAAGLAKFAVFNYDFATQGGAVGTIELPGTPIPAGAVILPGFSVQVGTAALASSGSPTIAVGTKLKTTGADVSTTNLKTATAMASFIGAVNTANVNFTTTTGEQTVSITIATAALTAGRFAIILPYFVPEAFAGTVTYR